MRAKDIILEQEGQEPEFIDFYDIKYDESGDKIREVKVNYFRLVILLKELGFRRLDIGKQSFIVRIIDNVVEEVSQCDVIDVFVEYLNTFPFNLPDGVIRDNLLNKMYRSLGTYFSDHILYRLVDDDPIEFNEHTQTEAFFYFRNGYVRVTKDDIQLLPYHALKKKIWKDQILDRDFEVMKHKDYQHFAFARFAENIANNWIDATTGKGHDPERFLSFQSIVGYCLHSYFEGKLKAVVLTDSRISEDAAGRSGKTLLCKAMGQLLNTHKFSKTFVELNGKDFDVTERFKYQELAIDTKLLHLNDVNRGFNFEQLFNDITEGIKCQRKNETPFHVNAKIIISTNRTIRIHGDSAKDRSLEFEMADYYSAERSPDREFGHWFFRDWDNKDWSRFDNFLLNCVQQYLKHGLVSPSAINLDDRKLKEETCEEFIKFMEDQKIRHDQEFLKRTLHSRFKKDNPDFTKLTQRTFTRWLRLYATHHKDFTSAVERRSNGVDLISFQKTKSAQNKEQ